MPIPWPMVVMFIVGIVLIAFVGRILIVPGRFIWRVIASGAAGAFFLFIVNLLSGITGFSIPINPFSALAVGFLGLPGAILMAALGAFL